MNHQTNAPTVYRYETHLHTSPASKCAKADVRQCLEFYRRRGFDGVFITNHFADGNIGCDKSLSYEEQMRFYFADYDLGKALSEEIGIKVFLGVEMTYKGTDFLIYGLEPEWYFAHPEIMEMEKSAELNYLREQGALVIQAHPYREARYIDHIRLFPRCVDGVEVLNAARKDFENRLALQYAENYGLLQTAGSDNHMAEKCAALGWMESDTPLMREADFVTAVRTGGLRLGHSANPEYQSADK